MTKVIMYRGVPGSYKSTAALEAANLDPENVLRVNRDSIRLMLFGELYFTDSSANVKEQAVTKVEHSLIKEGIKAGKTVIVDATNLNKRSASSILRIAGAHGAEVEVVDFEVTHEEASLTDSIREKSVGQKVIDMFFKKNSIPKDTGKLPDVPNVPSIDYSEFVPYHSPDTLGGDSVVLVDIDGTVAHMNGRSPYDYTRVSEDSPDPTVIGLVKLLNDAGLDIVFMSGRKSSCYDDTLEWLQNHLSGMDFFLIMRENDDDRPDYLVKYELFQKYINGKCGVALVIDDRLQVCRMWHRLGLKVFRVGDPDADF